MMLVQSLFSKSIHGLNRPLTQPMSLCVEYRCDKTIWPGSWFIMTHERVRVTAGCRSWNLFRAVLHNPTVANLIFAILIVQKIVPNQTNTANSVRDCRLLFVWKLKRVLKMYSLRLCKYEYDTIAIPLCCSRENCIRRDFASVLSSIWNGTN